MRLGVAIESGGARCAAAAGVLLALQEAGIVPWAYAGCGAGGLVAALAACGELDEQAALRYAQAAGRLRGVRAGRVRDAVCRQLGNRLLREQPPLALPCIDLESGAVQVLASRLPVRPDPRPWSRQAHVSTAVLATLAAPGVMPPVPWRGRFLCGGGATRGLLPQLLCALGADVVLAVRVLGAGCGQWERHRTAQAICAHALIAAPPPRGEVVIALENYGPGKGVLDCARLPEFLEAGRLAARQALPALRRLTCLGGNILLFPGNGAGKDG